MSIVWLRMYLRKSTQIKEPMMKKMTIVMVAPIALASAISATAAQAAVEVDGEGKVKLWWYK